MIRYLYTSTLLLISLNLFSQDETIPLLERNVTICTNGVPAQTVLTAIAQQADFVFSYSPSVIPEGNVSICIENQPVRVVINTLFNGAIDYNIRGKYIILKKSKTAVDSKDEVKIVEGYITDSQTGERVKNASIYDKTKLYSTTTNKYGYFKIEVPKDTDVNELKLSKQGYTDTLVLPTKEKRNFFNIKLAANKLFKNANSSIGKVLKSPLTDSLGNRSWIPSWLLTQPIRVHVHNVTDTIFKRVQFSILPFISTNKLLTANTANDFSINLVMGYTQEVRKFEIAGGMNIVRKNVKYAQFAGLGNIVGGSFKGLQAAGSFNIIRDSLRGVQSAGFANIIGGSFTGLQTAGSFNICNTFKGAQTSGGLNFATQFEGAQITGAYNESRIGDGVQISGAINTTKELTGCQLTGAVNIAKSIKGTQISGVTNITKKLDGNQIAGLINISNYVDGFQIGTINIADTCDGVPFGFLSFVRKGYHKLEFSIDEMRFASTSFRTGVPLFHNIISAGISTISVNGSPLLTYGYGFGTSIGKPSKLLWDIEVTSNKFMNETNLSSENSLYKFYTGIDWKILKKTSIAMGLSYNLLNTMTKEAEFNNSIYDLVPYTFSNSNPTNKSNLKTWIGGKIAIRFF